MYKSIRDRLKSQHEAIQHIILPLDETRLNKKPAPDKWSIHDHITHLAKYQPVFLDRVRSILEKDEPEFRRYKAENDPDFETWRKWSTEDLLLRLNVDRESIFRFVTGLSEAELDRKGRHVKYGKLTVVQWTEFFLLHEAHHIYTIFQLANDTAGS